MRLILFGLLLMCFSSFASEKETPKKENVRQRYFPVSWEPPSARRQGGSIVISPPKPNFTKKSTYIEIGVSPRTKAPTYKITLNGRPKTIRLGKTFKVGSTTYKFIGEENGSYVIEDVKTKKKILFTLPPKK